MCDILPQGSSDCVVNMSVKGTSSQILLKLLLKPELTVTALVPGTTIFPVKSTGPAVCLLTSLYHSLNG